MTVSDALFPDAAGMSSLTDAVAAYVSVGLLLSVIMCILGYVAYMIINFVR